MLTVNTNNKFNWAGISLVDCCEGNAMDTYFTLKLFNVLKEKLEEEGTINVMQNLIVPATPMFAEMEFEGMEVDPGALEEVGLNLQNKIQSLTEELKSYVEIKEEDNLGSNENQIEFLYTREGGFELFPPRKTDSGSPSTSAPTLELLRLQIEEELNSRTKKNNG